MIVTDFVLGKNKYNAKTMNKYSQTIKSNSILQNIVQRIKYGSD